MIMILQIHYLKKNIMKIISVQQMRESYLFYNELHNKNNVFLQFILNALLYMTYIISKSLCCGIQCQ